MANDAAKPLRFFDRQLGTNIESRMGSGPMDVSGYCVLTLISEVTRYRVPLGSRPTKPLRLFEWAAGDHLYLFLFRSVPGLTSSPSFFQKLNKKNIHLTRPIPGKDRNLDTIGHIYDHAEARQSKSRPHERWSTPSCESGELVQSRETDKCIL